MPPQPSRQEDRFAQGAAETNVIHTCIRHCETEWVMARSLDKGAGERLHHFAALQPGIRVEALNSSPHFHSGCAGGHGFAKTYRHRIRNTTRDLPKESSSLVAEDAAPKAVEADRDHRRVHAFHDALELAPEREDNAQTRN